MATRHRISNALTEGASFASTGAALGSVIPGVGTAWGAGVGGVIGILKGLLSDTELQELAESYARGEIDPQTEMAIEKMIGDRFDAIRREQGADAARRGVSEGTIGQRRMDEIYQGERDALADAFARTSFERQQYGLQLMQQQKAEQGQAFGSAIQTLGNLYSHHQDMQQQDWMRNFMEEGAAVSDKRWQQYFDLIGKTEEKPAGGTAKYSGSYRNTPFNFSTPILEPMTFESWKQSQNPAATLFHNWRNRPNTGVAKSLQGIKRGGAEMMTPKNSGAFGRKTTF